MYVNVNIKKSLKFSIPLEYQQKDSVESLSDILINKKNEVTELKKHKIKSFCPNLFAFSLIISLVHASLFNFSIYFPYLSFVLHISNIFPLSHYVWCVLSLSHTFRQDLSLSMSSLTDTVKFQLLYWWLLHRSSSQIVYLYELDQILRIQTSYRK